MSDRPITIKDIQKAATEGTLDGLRLRQVELASTPDCKLNCGVSNATALRASFVGAWSNHDGSELVLDVRKVTFQQPGAAPRQRDEALAYIRTAPPLPTITGE